MPINLSGQANRVTSTAFAGGLFKHLKNQDKLNQQLAEANSTAQERLQIAMNQKRDTQYQVANIKDNTAYDWNNPKFQAYLTNIDRQKAVNLRRSTVQNNMWEYLNGKIADSTASAFGIPPNYNKEAASYASELGLHLNSRIREKTGYSPDIETILGFNNGQYAQSILDEYNDWSQLPYNVDNIEEVYKDMDNFIDYLGSDEYYNKYKDYDKSDEELSKRRIDYMNKLYDDYDKWVKENPEATEEEKEMEKNLIEASIQNDEENEINWKTRRDLVNAIHKAKDLKEKNEFMKNVAEILEGGDK